MSDRADHRAFPNLKDAVTYPMLVFGVQFLFKSKRVQGHVEGITVKPDDTAKLVEIQEWVEKDAEAQLCIIESLPSVQTLILTCSSSPKMFLKIKVFFGKG